MRRTAGFAALALLLGAAGSAEARRTVDYQVDDATLSGWADEQGLAPLAPAPAPARIARLELAPGLDHEVVRGGIFCSAWTVDNPISKLIARMIPASAAPTAARPADIALKVERAATLSRCVQTGEMRAKCITRVTIDGQASAGGQVRPVHAEVERATNSVGACAGLTRGIALVSRDAVIALINAAQADDMAAR